MVEEVLGARSARDEEVNRGGSRPLHQAETLANLLAGVRHEPTPSTATSGTPGGASRSKRRSYYKMNAHNHPERRYSPTKEPHGW